MTSVKAGYGFKPFLPKFRDGILPPLHAMSRRSESHLQLESSPMHTSNIVSIRVKARSSYRIMSENAG